MNMLQNPFSTSFIKVKINRPTLSFHDFYTCSLKVMLKIGWLAIKARPRISKGAEGGVCTGGSGMVTAHTKLCKFRSFICLLYQPSFASARVLNRKE